MLSSSRASPRVFNTNNNAFAATGRGLLSGRSLATAFTVAGAGQSSYRRIQNADMRKETYRFKAPAVTGTVTISPMLEPSPAGETPCLGLQRVLIECLDGRNIRFGDPQERGRPGGVFYPGC